MRHLDLVAGPAVRRGDAVAVVGNGRRLSFAEVDDRIGRLGGLLRGLGLTPGDRVALLADNELEYLEIQGACLRSGFALVPLNTRLAEPELRFILEDCDSGVLVTGRNHAERGRKLAADLGIPHVLELGDGGNYDKALAGAVGDPATDPLEPELPATILYTSGTTGRPKGAVVDRLGFTARVVNGAAVVMLQEFEPAEALAAMERERVTTTVLVPTTIGMLLDSPAVDAHDLSALRLIIYGGSAIEPAPLRRALARFGCDMHQQYGMTETGGQTILRPADHDPDDEEKLASAGTEAVGLQVRVVDDGDRPLPQGEVGEIVCRGPS